MTLTSYQNFIGIDIGKVEIVVALYGSKTTMSFANSTPGFKTLHKTLKSQFKQALVILETTGGHELALILFLQKLNIAVHRANTLQVKSFIHSLGRLAKTDRLDAMALAHYGFERHRHLKLYPKANKEALKLYELAQRRLDLKKMLVQEKNRLKAPRCPDIVKDSCECVITMLEAQINTIDQHIQGLINRDEVLKARQSVLESIEGIGAITARELICFMPELGHLNQKQVASLAGLAPHAYESGKFVGQRRIKGGRREIRNALFMAAMAARRSHSRFKSFYEDLVARGKKTMVALTALMRKIIVIANARLKEFFNTSNITLTT